MSNEDARNWFVAQLKPQGLRRAEENLARQGFRFFFPKRAESVARGGRMATLEKPLFPGYLFVQFDPSVSGWASINATRGVARLVISDIRHPRPLPDSFMAGLMARCDARGLIGGPIDLKAGDRIRVISGPFARTIAEIEMLEDGERIQILMDLMGRETRISIAAERVEKL